MSEEEEGEQDMDGRCVMGGSGEGSNLRGSGGHVLHCMGFVPKESTCREI